MKMEGEGRNILGFTASQNINLERKTLFLIILIINKQKLNFTLRDLNTFSLFYNFLYV